MMMMPERKKAVTLIIEGMGEGPSSSMEDDYSYAKRECCKKIMDCMEEKDVEGFMEYMGEFIDMCSHGDKKSEMDY